MSSEEFFDRFLSGALDDAADYFEWAGLNENVLLYKETIQSLETADAVRIKENRPFLHNPCSDPSQ